ncbi:hypothetical protein, partial [Pectobacterium brasiliense]|uniref:hypothetical protein n=1 Tax=Pectobacterium brasiliense TaxID=180957 RepID=UPI001968DBC5
KFLFVHNLPVSIVGVNISKTGNYTILITGSILTISRAIALSFMLTKVGGPIRTPACFINQYFAYKRVVNNRFINKRFSAKKRLPPPK